MKKFVDTLIYNFQDRFKPLKDIQKRAGAVPERKTHRWQRNANQARYERARMTSRKRTALRWSWPFMISSGLQFQKKF